jgi:SAM-dependent methyltransferase
MSRNLSHGIQGLPRRAFWLTFHALSRVPGIRARGRKALIRTWYQIVSSFGRGADLTFMNYGYAPLDPSEPHITLRADQETNRYAIQLYERVAGAVDLVGKDVLEVGCGRGGGAHFIMQHFRPRSVTGIDFADRAIRFCRRRYRVDGLSFAVGDAEKLQFPPRSFDVVVNLESSHNYPNMSAFLGEVHRVLRPGGYLLFADHRPKEVAPGSKSDDIAMLRRQLDQSGLDCVDEERINANVVRALDLNNRQSVEGIRRHVPKMFQSTVKEFAGVKGSELYEKLKTLELQYIRFVLQKSY